jgi:hypothetical protein
VLKQASRGVVALNGPPYHSKPSAQKLASAQFL